MKKGLIFATTLAMALGVGVAVGAHQNKVAEVKADGKTTLYCQMDQSWWNADNAAIAVHYWGGTQSTDWPGERGTKVSAETEHNIWKFSVPSDSTGIIFLRRNPSDEGNQDWGAKTANLALPTDGKNLYTITSSTPVWGDPGVTGEWSKYVEPAPDVPEEDGYYVVGTKSNWKFAGATKMDAGQGTDKAQLIKYAGTAGEEFKVRSYLNGAKKWYGDSNYAVGESDKYLNIYINKDDGLWVEDWVEPDIPAEEGYYICGEFSSVPSWKYDGATKMTATSQDGNVAYHMNFSLAVGDQLRVRSYFDAQDPKDRWATVGNEIDTTDPNRLFDKEGDNLKARVAGYYDVYAKYEQKQGDAEEKFYFYVSPHVNTYEIEMTAVKFIGATKEGTVAQDSQVAYAGQVFNPVQPAMTGYALRGYYTDEACTTAYVAHEFEAAGHLYAKYTKAGFYVTYGTSGYSIDGATPMTTAGIAGTNKAEAALTVAAKNSTYSFVYYGEDGKMSGHSGLGDTYAYAENEDSHIKFTELGTYAVYWSEGDNKIYLNDGSTAYATTFLTNTGAVCQGDHEAEGYISSLKAVWAQEKLAFENLSDGAKAEIRAVGFNGGDEKGSAVKQLVARYHHIVWKYGSEEFEDFIFNSEQPIPPHHDAFIGGFNAFNSSDNTTMIIVIAIAAVSALAFTTLLVFKKRKQK